MDTITSMEHEEPVRDYKEICGCVWRNGKRIRVCPKHRHKDGIQPDKQSIFESIEQK